MRRLAVPLLAFLMTACGGGGAGALDRQRSTLQADKAQVVADGTDSAHIAIHLTTENGKPLPGATVALTVTGHAVVSPASVTTDASGNASASLTSVRAETEQLHAQVTTDGSAASLDPLTVDFVAGPPDADHSTLTVPARGHVGEKEPVQVQLADAHANPCIGVAVSLSVTGGGSLTPASGVAGPDGTFTTSLTSTTVGTEAVTATASGTVLSAQVQMAAAAWRNVGPDGGSVKRLVLDPSNAQIAYAVTPGGGLYKTTDGGATWAPIDVGLTQFAGLDLAIHAAHPDHLAVAGYSAIFVSSNGGASWQQVSDQVGAPIAFDPTDPNTLYANAFSGLVKSTDGGATWSTASTAIGGLELSALVVDPNDAATLYAIDSGTVWKSTDGGATWSQGGTGLGTLALGARLVVAKSQPTAVYAFDTNAVWRSSDAAGTWSALSPPTSGTTDLATAPSAPGTVYLVTVYGMYRSTDAGTGWTAMTEPASGIATVAVSPGDASVVWAGTSSSGIYPAGGVYLSQDAGSNWTLSNSGMKAHAVNALLAEGAPAGVFAATDDEGLLWTNDGGASWSSFGSWLNQSLYAVAHDRYSASMYDVFGDFGLVYQGSGSGWSQLGDALPSSTSGSQVVTTLDYDFVTLKPKDGIYRMPTDGSAGWTAVNTGLTDPTGLGILDLTADPWNPGVLYAATFSGLFVTTDNGDHWTQTPVEATQSVAVTRIAVSPSSPDIVYVAGGQGQVYVGSASEGFVQVRAADDSSASPTALAIDPSNPDIVYLGIIGEGVLKSTDGGHTWANASSGLFLKDVRAIEVDPDDSSVVYLANGAGIFRSTTAGE